MTSPQMFTFSWSELTSSLASTAQQLHMNGDLVDVTLSAGGKIFHAHKLVLSAASPLLMEMLKSTKCTNPVVLLAGITADDLEAILQFIYHGEVTIDPDRLPCLLQAAQCLNIRALTPPPSFDKIVPSSVYPSASDLHQGGKIPTTNPHCTVKKQRRSNAKAFPNRIEEDYNGISNDHYIGEIGMDQTLNEGDPSELATSMRRSSIVSDLPVSCHICGALIRQSRNLRRHMELVHMRMDYSQRGPKKKKSVGTTSPLLGSSSPSVEESPANDLDCYAPSAKRVVDPYEETADRNHLDSRASQDSLQSPPNVSQSTDPNQAQPHANALPADHAATSSTSSASTEVPTRPPGYASGNIDPSLVLPPQSRFPPHALPADHAATSSSSSTSAEVPTRPPGYASGNVNPSHVLPPQSHFPPQAPSVQRLNVYHGTTDDHS